MRIASHQPGTKFMVDKPGMLFQSHGTMSMPTNRSYATATASQNA